jgi:hypothetical protein
VKQANSSGRKLALGEESRCASYDTLLECSGNMAVQVLLNVASFLFSVSYFWFCTSSNSCFVYSLLFLPFLISGFVHVLILALFIACSFFRYLFLVLYKF